MSLTLSEIHLYPVKSLRGVSPQRWAADAFGLAGDRRWMLVDAQGAYVTQRQVARMALVDTSLDGDRLVLSAEGMEPLVLPRELDTGEARQVKVWNDQVTPWTPAIGPPSA